MSERRRRDGRAAGAVRWFKALGGARLLYEDDTESSDGDEPLGALDEACDWAAFEEAGGCFELAFPVAFDEDDGWRWDEAAALCFVSKHATTLRYDASLEAVARRDFRRAAAAILRAAHRDGVVAASCRALDALGTRARRPRARLRRGRATTSRRRARRWSSRSSGRTRWRGAARSATACRARCARSCPSPPRARATTSSSGRGGGPGTTAWRALVGFFCCRVLICCRL